MRLFRFLKQYAGEAGMGLRSVYTAPAPTHILSWACEGARCFVAVAFAELAGRGQGIKVT